jgi:hypothetical protein
MTGHPLTPLAGEALERQAHERFAYRFFFAGGVSTGLAVSAISAWIGVFRWPELIAVMPSVAALAALIWMYFEFRRLNTGWRRLLLGARGEREVSAILDELRSRNYFVFHQVPIPLANGEFLLETDQQSAYAADHVIVGPAGAYVIETKKRSEREGRVHCVEYTNGRITVDGREPDRCPLQQVTRYATGLGKYLRQHTGINVFLRGVVLYPGAAVRERRGSGAGGKPWVLDPHRLSAWLRQELRQAGKRPGRSGIPLSTRQIETLKDEIESLQRRAFTNST